MILQVLQIIAAIGTMLKGELLSVDIASVLGTHLGHGADGFACVSAREKS
jgi:hypothetical protein